MRRRTGRSNVPAYTIKTRSRIWGTAIATSFSNNFSMNRVRTEDPIITHAALLPVCGDSPRVLVLGSFPSALSLSRNEYYGNLRNRFWAVMEELFGIPAALSYPERCRSITGVGLALWDVVAACSRPGSADCRIRNVVPNDIAEFIRVHPSIILIALNGSTAGRLYHRLAAVQGIPAIILPSTSPGEKPSRSSATCHASCFANGDNGTAGAVEGGGSAAGTDAARIPRASARSSARSQASSPWFSVACSSFR